MSGSVRVSRSGLLLALVLAAGARESGAQTATESLGSVQAKMVAAVGGEAAWERVSLLELRGVRNRNGYEMGLNAWLGRPHRVRVEHRLRGLVETFIWDGEQGWVSGFRDEGVFRPASSEEARERLDEVEKYLRWPAVWERYAAARLDGVVERGDGLAHRLELVGEGGETETWLVDVADGRVLEIVEARVGEEGEFYELRSFAWDYRDVEGLRLPFYVEIDHGTGLYSFEVESVAVDPPVSEELFAPPAKR